MKLLQSVCPWCGMPHHSAVPKERVENNNWYVFGDCGSTWFPDYHGGHPVDREGWRKQSVACKEICRLNREIGALTRKYSGESLTMRLQKGRTIYTITFDGEGIIDTVYKKGHRNIQCHGGHADVQFFVRHQEALYRGDMPPGVSVISP
jgi:hypothetical protein